MREVEQSPAFIRALKSRLAEIYESKAKAAPTTAPVVRATVLGGGAGLFKQLLRNDLSGTFVNVGLDIGVAYRGLYGDAVSAQNAAIRTAILGTDARHFVGVETGFNLQVGQLRGALHFYFFPETDIRGFGRGQVVAGFALQGAIVSQRTIRDRS